MSLVDLGNGVLSFSVDRGTIERLGWTLLHFVWQGSVVAAALAIFHALAARSRPQLRYLTACTALALMTALPIATFVTTPATSSRLGASPAVENAGIAKRLPNAAPRDRAAVVFLAARSSVTRPAGLAAARSNPGPLFTLRQWSERLRSAAWLPWFVALWALGVALFSLRLLGGWWLVRRLARSPENVPIHAWQERLGHLARAMGVSRPVRLLRSAAVTVPTAIGWLRPAILLPASTLTGLGPAHIESILAHELAHIRRHDYAINLLQSLIETLLFYHPAVWWVSRRIREERELCCDDLAVRACGDPVTYARALYELETLRGRNVRLALAATDGSLLARIARLLGTPHASHVEAARGFAWALIALVVVFGAGAAGAVRLTDRAPAAPARPAQTAGPVASFARPDAVARPFVASRIASAAIPVTPAVETTPPTAQAPLAALPAIPAVLPVLAPMAMFATYQPPDRACETPAPEAASAPNLLDLPNLPDVPDPPPPPAAPAPIRFSSEEWDRMSGAGVTPRYVTELWRAGYGSLTAGELIRLAQHGVSSNYAGSMRRILRSPSVEDLVRLASHGVSSEYARKMRRSLGNLAVEDLVRLASHGISSEFVAGMRELDLQDLTTEDLIRLASSGVTLEWFSSLRWMGYEDVTVERAIELRNSGVTADFAASLRMLKRHRLSMDELRTLRNQGVDVEYAATLLGLLREDLTVDQLVRLRQQGVTVEFVAAMNALGYSTLSADELIALRQQGVEPEFVAEMAGAGYPRLAVRDLIRMRQSGVDAEFVERLRAAGLGRPEVTDLVRMRQRGIPDTKTEP